MNVGEPRLARIPVPDRAALPVAHPDRPRAAAALRPLPARRTGDDMPLPLRGTDWGRLFRLSYRLSHGVKSELAVVRRVENYLLHEGRYHYTTDVGTPGIEPLMEFLFHTHAGVLPALRRRRRPPPPRRRRPHPRRRRLRHRRTGGPGHLGGPRRGRPRLDRGLLPERRLGPVQPDPGRRRGRRLPRPRRPPAERRLRRRDRWRRRRRWWAAPPSLLALVLLVTRLARRRRGPRTQLAELLVRLAPEPSGPRTTLRSLHPTLTEIGPATADLALVAEHARFAPAATPEPSHPGLTVWRALVADVGLWRSLTLMLRAAATANR